VLFFVLPDTVALLGAEMKKENLLLFGTALSSAVVMFAVSRWFPQREDERVRTAPFLDRLATAIGQERDEQASDGQERGGEEASTATAASFSPFRVVGVSIMLIAALMLAVAPLIPGRIEIGLNVGIAVALMLVGGWMLLAARRSRPSATMVREGEA
jgi:hypothetical protein